MQPCVETSIYVLVAGKTDALLKFYPGAIMSRKKQQQQGIMWHELQQT